VGPALPATLAFLCPAAVLAGYAQARWLVQYLRLRRPGRDRLVPRDPAGNIVVAGFIAAPNAAPGVFTSARAGGRGRGAPPGGRGAPPGGPDGRCGRAGRLLGGGPGRGRRRHVRRAAGPQPAARAGPRDGRRAMKRSLGPLADGPFDLLVLGGGITGAGAALDA